MIILIAGPHPEFNKLALPNQCKISVLRDQFHAIPTLPPLLGTSQALVNGVPSTVLQPPLSGFRQTET
jgi:hypothetical protein